MHEVLIKQNLMLLRWAQKRVKKEVCRKKMTHSKCIRAEQGRWTEPSPHTWSNVNSVRLGDGADVQEPRTHGHSRNAERAFDKVGVSNRSVEASLTDPNIKTCVLTPPADGERYSDALDDINTVHQATKKTRELRTLQVKDYNSDPGRIYTTKTHCIDKGKLLNTCKEPNNLGSEKGKLSASNEKKRLSHRKNKRDNGLLLTRDHESNRDAVLCELRSIFVDTSMSSDLHNIIMDINHDRAEYSSSSHSSSSSTSSSGHRHYSHKLYKNHSWHPGMPEDGCNGYHRPRRNKRYASVDSADEYSVLKISDVDFYYRDVDITGPTPEVRFPWQRDIAVQCELIQKNNNNDETNVNRNIVSGLGGSNGCYNANDGIGTANRNDRSRIHRSNSSEGRSADFMRAGKTGRKHVRPHSITLPEDYHLPGFSPGIPRWNSYDLNGLGLLPRQFAARHSIPEDPEDMAGTSNPLSRLDTLVHGGVPHSSSHRGSTESAPTVVLDWDDDEEEGGTEEQRKEREEREGVLPSPSVSPVPWLTDQDALAALTETLSGKQTTGLLNQANKHKGKFLTVPAYSSRSSSAATSEESDEGDETRNAHETPLPILRRGRRAAIFETQEIGDTSPYISPAEEYTDDEDESPSLRRRRRSSLGDLPSDTAEGAPKSPPSTNHAEHRRHRKKVLTKRNTIADFGLPRSQSGSTQSLNQNEDAKKVKSLSLLKLIDKKRSKTLAAFEEMLSKLKPSEFKDNTLIRYKDLHWSDLIASTDKSTGDSLPIPETERKRREAVWELLKSECVFLVDHLMVLKHCFMEPLKKVQVEGFLMSADVQELFGNLDELCYVSYTFCKDFLASLLKDMGPTCFGSTAALISAFERLTKHSRNGEVYHRYCLNYSNALAHLENVRKQHEEFGEFDKWCSQDPRCNRLQLTDLLVAPMQHWTKMPLLLKEIRKYTENTEERMQLTESIEDVEKSLEQLNDKMKWVKNFERVLEIQHQIVWPSISETDPKSFIPEFLKSTLSQQPCERLLASPKRHLMYEGPVTLVEQSKGQEMYIFLFDDIFLLTKLKKSHRKKTSVVDQNPNNYKADASPGTYTVYRQPISLDRFSLHDVGPAEAQANGLKNAFVIVQITRFQQIVGIYTFQAPSETAKAAWLDNLREAKEKYNGDRNASRHNSFKENLNPSNTGAVSQTLTVTPQLVPDSRNSPRLVKKRSEMRRIHERSQTIDMSGYGTLPKSFVQHKTKSVDSVYL